MFRLAFRLSIALCALLAAGVVAAQTPAPKPITKGGLVDALKIGGLTAEELAKFVQQRGVDFAVTAPVETELRGAGAKPELIEAVRANFRQAGAAPVAPKATPLGKGDILTLLQVGTPSSRIETLVAQRGLSFVVTPDIAAELQAAGATPALLGALGYRPAAPAPATPGITGAPGPSIASIKEMRKIFIEKMPNDLDQYLKAEVSKQLSGRLVVVLAAEEADAVMTGVGDNKTGTGAMITGRYLGLHDNATAAVTIVDRSGKVVLWSSEAGDRSLLLGAVKRGGPRKVADRLIGKLRKTLQN